MKTYLLTAGIVLALTGCGGGGNTDLQETAMSNSIESLSPFQACFGSDYNDKVFLPEAAYQKGECFMSLARNDTNVDGSLFNESEVGANQNLVLQYANSWYSKAAKSGHTLAKIRLDHNQLALYALEDSVLSREKTNYELLASEKQFGSLDVDRNGFLTRQEVSPDMELAQSFTSSDFDENGEISLVEYIIYTGEATAAGVKSSTVAE